MESTGLTDTEPEIRNKRDKEVKLRVEGLACGGVKLVSPRQSTSKSCFVVCLLHFSLTQLCDASSSSVLRNSSKISSFPSLPEGKDSTKIDIPVLALPKVVPRDETNMSLQIFRRSFKSVMIMSKLSSRHFARRNWHTKEG